MSFSRRDIRLIVTSSSITASVLAVVSIAIIAILYWGSTTVPGTEASERTTWDATRILQSEYLAFNPLKVKYPNDKGVDVIDSLKGFVFSADHLDEIIRGNFHYPSGSGKMPDEVLFLLGQDGTFDDKEGSKYGNMRLTAVGMKDNVILKGAASGTLVSLFDKADPCPPNCPD